MDKSALQHAIRAEFENVPYPGDDRIGDPAGGDDAESVTGWFCGMNWRALELEEWLWDIALYYMTPEACHYYVPAYLLGALEGKEGALGAIHLCLHPRCIDPRHPAASERFLAIVALFSPGQKRLVADVVAYAQAATVKRLREMRENGPLPGLEDDFEEISEEEKERHRAWLDREIEQERTYYDPLIEYWRSA